MLEKTNINIALSQYNNLDRNAQCVATAMLQLMSTVFQCIYQSQTAMQKINGADNLPAPEIPRGE